MRIGFDAKRYYHNHTGLGNYSRTLVKDLRRLFPETEMVLYDEKSVTRTFRLGRKAAADGCDLFHGLSNELPFDLVHMKGMPRSVVTIHDTAWRTFPQMYQFADRQIYDFKYGHAARHADCVVAISESTKRDVMRFYGVEESRIRVIYQPVQGLFYDMPSPSGEAVHGAACDKHDMGEGVMYSGDYFLSVGSINARKNLLGTLKAYACLKPENRPRLIVVGRGRSYEQRCRDFVQKHGLERDVEFVGSVTSTNQLCSLYRGAMAMIYPSFYEGFGLPVVEALLSGCPVLTSNVSSLPEAAGPGALLCSPHDTEEMAHMMQMLADDALLRRRLAAEGEHYCRTHFDPDTLTRQMFNLYQSLIR